MRWSLSASIAVAAVSGCAGKAGAPSEPEPAKALVAGRMRAAEGSAPLALVQFRLAHVGGSRMVVTSDRRDGDGWIDFVTAVEPGSYWVDYLEARYADGRVVLVDEPHMVIDVPVGGVACVGSMGLALGAGRGQVHLGDGCDEIVSRHSMVEPKQRSLARFQYRYHADSITPGLLSEARESWPPCVPIYDPSTGLTAAETHQRELRDQALASGQVPPRADNPDTSPCAR